MFVAVLLLACRVLRSWLLLELLIVVAVAVGLSELLLVDVDKGCCSCRDVLLLVAGFGLVALVLSCPWLVLLLGVNVLFLAQLLVLTLNAAPGADHDAAPGADHVLPDALFCCTFL